MAQITTIQITLDEDVKKNAEAMLEKIGLDIGAFVTRTLESVAIQGAMQKASESIAVERTVGKPGVDIDTVDVLAESAAQKAMSRSDRLAALERLKKYRIAVPADFCPKAELAKARDEKYADFV